MCACSALSLINAVSSSYCVKLCLASEVFHRKIQHICHGTKSTVVYVNSFCVHAFFSLRGDLCKNIARDCGHLEEKMRNLALLNKKVY